MSEYKVGDYDIEVIHAEMLKIMVEIDKVCRKHNIHYILDGGTMLGAVRHNGFIPWDDDADLAMIREDYDKFVEVANTELPEGYRLECYENTKEYPYNFGKVRATNTVFKERLTGKLNINHGLFVDIFPMDYVDESDYRKHAKLVQHLTAIRFYKLKLYESDLTKSIKYLPFSVLSVKFINKMIDKQMKYYFGKSDKVCKLCHFGKNKPPIDKSLFTDVIDFPFEDQHFYIPKEYDAFLRGRYGDYMKLPPVEAQKPCHGGGEVRI